MRNNIIRKGNLEVHLIWFDSLGAKSSSLFIRTPDLAILIDPGAAEMQPSYPLSEKKKKELRLEAIEHIAEYADQADMIFISHYHYDHHILPEDIPAHLGLFYKGKTIFVKNPNHWINRSQWKRARIFFESLAQCFKDKGNLYRAPEHINLPSLQEDLPLAAKKDYGNYNERKRQLLKKGKERIQKLKEGLWEQQKWLNECEFTQGRIVFADGKRFKIGSTQIIFTKPLYHGIEYDRIGWVVGVEIIHDGNKVIYTSDLQGPQIEDYARWLVLEDPDILILDGFPTYLLGFMVNQINMRRAQENILYIAKHTKSTPIIYDHHLVREPSYKERFSSFYEKFGSRVMTAAEYMGKTPLILRLTK
jgi:hypothetical protein